MLVTFGLDISHHQPASLDLAACRRDGCELAVIKAGEGSTYLDPDFVGNLAEAEAAGMLAAAYWYVRADVTAQAHVDTIRQVVPPRIPVIPDVEAGSGDVQLVRDIVTMLRAAGYVVPLIYLPRWYWLQLGSPSLAGLPPLWSSRYPDTTVGLLASEWAQVPAAYWEGYGGLDVALLQFTSSASIGGYSPLDASAFRGTRDQLAALLGHPTTAHTIDEESTVKLKPGKNIHQPIPAAGKPPYLYLMCGYGDHVDVLSIVFIGQTPTGDGADYRPGGFEAGDDGNGNGGTPWRWEHDRPGPIKIPDGTAMVMLRYTTDTDTAVAYVG